MRIGVLGLGHIGHPIASRLHLLGHEVHSWTRSEKNVPWVNATEVKVGTESEFDCLFIASGGARPGFGDFNLEVATTYDLISNFTLTKKTKLYYISSGAVYGECENPKSETHTPVPKTDYGVVKLKVEKKLHAVFGDRLSVLRVGNLIDEDNPYGIVAHLIASIQSGVFGVLGKPDDCRDYLTKADFQLCIEQLIEIDRQPEVMNLGSGTSVSLEQIVLLLKEASENRISVNWARPRLGDVSQTRLDVTQMRHQLQNEPEDPIEKIKVLINNQYLPNHFSN